MLPRNPRCPPVAARVGGAAPRLTGGQVKPRVTLWRPLVDNPSGRGCLHAGLRHHSVVYRHTLLRSSLTRAQAAPGAGHVEASGRL
ncbi:hypothetical protein DYST_02525 [Dyella terrae]|nr:hypothetical protein DYST_02525 [Dyella terrae]